MFVTNLTDERGTYDILGFNDWGSANFAEGRPHFQSSYVVRPREYGIRFIKRWGN